MLIFLEDELIKTCLMFDLSQVFVALSSCIMMMRNSFSFLEHFKIFQDYYYYYNLTHMFPCDTLTNYPMCNLSKKLELGGGGGGLSVRFCQYTLIKLG